MSTKSRYPSLIAALVLSSFTATVAAAEVAAVFDAKSCKADYPKASLMNEEQGTVSMSFLVAPDGAVVESKLEKTSGFKNLDKAAIKSISACKFKPGTKDGAPAQTWTKVDYAWKLD
ncbi:MAG TPA: energy transducer TonB [Telluria sp.]|nr:energy transducer TonB [Telluria sp.]